MTSVNPYEEKSMSKFMILWMGQAVSLVGSRLVQFSLIWWLTQESGSATILAMASLVGLVPQVVLGPVIGALVDRWNRKSIMLISDSMVAAASLLLAYLFWTESVAIWHVFTLLFVRAVGGAFHGPSMLSTTTLMVPEKHLTRIQGLNQMLQGGLNIIAAPIGALLLVWIAIVGILFIDVVTALFAIIPLLFMAIPQPKKAPPAEGEAESSMGQEIKAGFIYVWQRPGILMVMIMAAMINFLLTPAVSLVPLLVTEHFKGGPMQYATFEMGVGIGILVGGIALSVWGGFSKRIYTSLAGIIGIGIGVIAVGLAPSNLFIMAVAGIFFAGVMMPFANGSIQAIMQVIVAPEFQGRVFTLLGTIAMGMAPLGLIIAGPVADLLGVRFWFAIGGIVCLVMGGGALFVPAITHIEERHTFAPAETEVVAV